MIIFFFSFNENVSNKLIQIISAEFEWFFVFTVFFVSLLKVHKSNKEQTIFKSTKKLETKPCRNQQQQQNKRAKRQSKDKYKHEENKSTKNITQMQKYEWILGVNEMRNQ